MTQLNEGALTEVLPPETIEQLRRILESRPSGTIELHVKDGVVLAGEFQHKDKLTIPRE